MKKFIIIIFLIGGIYSGLWFSVAYLTNNLIDNMASLKSVKFIPEPKKVSNFPFWHKIEYSGEISTPDFSLTASNASLQLQVRYNQININITANNGFKFIDKHARQSYEFDNSYVHLEVPYPLPKSTSNDDIAKWQSKGTDSKVRVSSLLLEKDNAKVTGEGIVRLDTRLQPTGKIDLSIYGYSLLLSELKRSGIISSKHISFAEKFVGELLGNDKPFNTPLIIKDRNIFIGPIKTGRLNKINWRYSSSN
jgi:hypothetical protein